MATATAIGYDSGGGSAAIRFRAPFRPSPVAENPPKGTYALVSLGCPKNLVDSERMAGLLDRAGYRLVAEPKGADFVLINTCGFIRPARGESHEVIREMLRLKQRRLVRGVVVAGCLVERSGQALLDRFPEIDQLIGVFARERIAACADRLMEGRNGQRTILVPPPARPLPDDPRRRLTLPHVAYLKISEGCHRRCSFCTIPQIRGPLASKPIEQLVDEAEALADQGARELILVAQDTSAYGLDLPGRPRLAGLLRRLEGVHRLAWIRLMYLYPTQITDELIDVVAGGRKILPYLDLPLQHIDDEILRRMGRRVGRADTERLLERLRKRIDALVLRTTLMVGFPGETPAQFKHLLDFVRRWRFERLGVFCYCKEPGTPAAGIGGHLPQQVKQARRHRLLAAQQQIAFDWARAQVGRRLEVLLDRCVSDRDNALVGRSYADAPEIDGVVYVTGEGLHPGQMAPCEIVASGGYDLVGVELS